MTSHYSQITSDSLAVIYEPVTACQYIFDSNERSDNIPIGDFVLTSKRGEQIAVFIIFRFMRLYIKHPIH